MADGIGGGVKQIISEVSKAVAEPLKDEVGKAIEVGTQSVVGATPKPQDPLEQQKKQEDEQKRKQWAIHVIEWNKQLQENQNKYRQEQQQKVMQQKQGEQQEKQVKQFKLVEKQKKQENIAVQMAERKTELRKGIGG